MKKTLLERRVPTQTNHGAFTTAVLWGSRGSSSPTLILCALGSQTRLQQPWHFRVFPFFSSTVWKPWCNSIKRHLKKTCYEEHQWLLWHRAFFPERLPFSPEQKNKKRTQTNNECFLSNFYRCIFNQIICNSKSQLNFENIFPLWQHTYLHPLAHECRYLRACSCTETTSKASNILILLYSNDCCNQKESQK